MRRFYTIVMLLLSSFFLTKVDAQVSNYIFNQSVGTYTEITGGTVYGTTTSDDQRFVDPAVPLGVTTPLTGVGLPIGFSFIFNGVSFDRLAINNNGWISLGQSSLTPSVDINSTSSYLPLSSTSANTPAALRSRIAAFGRDLGAQTNAELRLETIGAAPNRTCVVQFKGYKRFGASGDGDNLNFQIRLNETTNIVEIVYGTIVFGTGATTTSSAQIGLGGNASTDFINRATTASNDWNTTTAGAANTAACQLPFTGTVVTAPVSGTTFRYSPPPPCGATPTAQPTNLNLVVASNTSITGSFVASSPVSDAYLVVRTTTNTAPIPVNGTIYTAGNNAIGFIESNSNLTTFTSTGLNPATTYYYWVFSSTGICTGTPSYLLVNPISGNATTLAPGSITSTAQGGLWSSAATWVGGVLPAISDNVIIADGATVTIDGAYTVNSLTIGQGASGVLQWNATTNALTVRNDITIAAGAKLYAYTSGGTGQTINIGGNFTNNGYANLAMGSTLINFNGSALGASLAQTLGGTGTFEGNGTSGIIRSLFFQTTGSSSISTTQNLITSSFAHTAGSLNTNGKLTIDNTAQVYGRPLNTQVANVVVTNMGTTAYTDAPVVFGAAITLWTANSAAVLNTRYFSGNNVYVATTAGTFDATTAPTHTSGIVSNGTVSLLWIGTLGTLGNPFQQTAVTLGTQYFYGDNLYVCTVAGVPSATAPPTHTSGAVTSGTATFLFVGSAAKVSVNFSSGTVRSLTLTTAGSGYSSAPSIAFSLNGGTGAGVAATVVHIQSIAGTANSLTQKSGIATITGGLNINSTQGATAFSGVGAISTTGGGVNYTVAPTVGFAGPTAINLVTNGGSGYTAAPTVTVTGGNLVSGTALTSSSFTVVVANGRVVSAYLNTATTATYSVPPTLAFSAGNATLAFPTGCWPTATAVIGANGQITDFNVTNAGFGYVAAPTVGIGTTTATANGGTFTTVATAPTARIALYNATLAFFTPAPSNVEHDGSVIPANRKLNNLTMNSALGANLTSNLELFGSSPLTLTAGELNLGSNSLTFSHPSYAGTSGSATASVRAASITLNTPGGSLTRTFPYFPAVAIATGTGSLATGSTVTTLTTSRTAAPSGSITGGGINAIGTRAYRVQANTGSSFGVNPTITLNFNVNDSLTTDNPSLYIGQSTSLTGPWTVRSAASGTGALPATGSRTTATTGAGPIVPTGDDYYAWLATEICTGTPITGVIAATGSTAVCAGTTVAFTSTVFTLGTGMTYRWQTSTDNVNWDNTTTASAGAFSIRVLDSIWVRRVDSCTNSSLFAISNAIKINIAAGLALPWTEGFEGITTVGVGILPECWSIQNISGTLPTSSITVDGNRGPRTGTKFYHTQWNATSWVYTPGFDLVAGTSYDFSFYMSNKSGVAGFIMDVAYGSNPSDVSMINPLLSATAVTNTPYQQFKYSFTPATTGKYHFGIKSTSTTSAPWYLSFDDFKLEVTPTCNEPTNLVLSNVTSTGVDVVWDAPTVGSSPASYSLYYATSSTAPTLTTAPTIHGISGTATVLTGLTPATTYYLWVRSKCSTTDSSSWSAVKQFTTLCTSVSSFTQNFDGVTVPALPSCWLKVGTTGTAVTQASGAFTTPNALNMNSSSTTNIAMVSMPPVNNADAGTHRLRFRIRASTTVGGIIEAGYLTDPLDQATFVSLGSFTTTSTTVYNDFEVTPVNAPPGVTTLAFRHTGAPANAVLIDNVVYETIPTCNEPTNVQAANITTTTADLTWDSPTAGGSPISYSLYYSTTNTPPTLTTAPTLAGVNGPAVNLTGLNPASTYFLWVRSKCSPTDSSGWSNLRTFTTLCAVITSLPWNEGFEGVTAPAALIFPNCWGYERITGTNGPGTSNVNSTTRSPRTGANYMYSQWSTTAWMYTPSFQLNAGTSYDFSFYMMNKDGINGFTMDVAYGSSATNAGMVNVLQAAYAANNTSYTLFKYTFTPTVSGAYNFGVKSSCPTATPNFLSFDDFRLEVTPSCAEPTAVTATNITTNAADVSWTAPPSSGVTGYTWELRTSGAAGSGATGLVTSGTTANTNVNLTGLNGTTNYTFYVRTNCATPTVSSYASRSFNTLITNDECSGAVQVFATGIINVTNIGATQSLAPSLCSGFTSTAAPDVWFRFVATQNGSVTMNTSGFDVVIEAYSGSCGSLTSLGCVDVAGTDETFTLNGLVAGTTYYCRIYGYGTLVSGQGNFTLNFTGTALPATITSFKGEKRGSINQLSWTTSTEVNNSGFELQRSADGVNFTAIGFIKSKADNGTSNQVLNYIFNDERPLSSVGYYRLKQIDKDGKYNYSQVVVLKSDRKGDFIVGNIYPNPVSSILNVSIESTKNAKVEIVIVNTLGMKVHQQSANLVTGQNIQTMNINRLAAGLYHVQMITPNGEVIQAGKVTKQ